MTSPNTVHVVFNRSAAITLARTYRLETYCDRFRLMKPEPSIFEQDDIEADERAMRDGEAAAEAGRVVPHEDVAAWLETWGTPDETPAPAKWFK
jgi:predicted transcriptional regulator